MMRENNKWVACWGNATSITNRSEAIYSKDITLRYPIRMCFSGSMLRFRFSNLTGTEPINLTKVFVGHTPITFGGKTGTVIMPGMETESDAIRYAVSSGDVINVSIYLADYTQMNSGTLITGPLSRGFYSYGDFAEADELPLNLTRHTNWFYFLNTIDVLTSDEKHAIVCYGDSITAQSWPDYLAQIAFGSNASIIRRAVSGTRILRQYDCITYQAYGLKGATRFPIEMNVAGATDVIIQHGINDIIHPVGTDVNPFRPWSDLPTVEEMERGVEEIYVKPAKAMGLKVWSGTLLPIYGWRTYNEDREEMRQRFNEWLRTSPIFDGCIDFDAAVRSTTNPKAFAEGYDSGDHLHPSESAYEAMARAAASKALTSSPF
ncbi:MAG: lipase [Prevotella sp.]|nr:lipase [Prevotella sp.]